MLVVGTVYEVKESTYVNAPPDKVWAAFTRIERWVEWSQSWLEATPISNNPWSVGGRIRLVVKPWWLPLATDPIVAEISPPGTIILVSDPPGIQRQTTVHFDRQDHGTHASISVWQQGFMQWTLPFYSPSWALRRILQEWRVGLKSDSEEL